jgi:hypothetical protein
VRGKIDHFIGERDVGHIFEVGVCSKMHSRGKWVWLQHQPHIPRGSETIRENAHLNGYMHAADLEDARAVIASRAGVAVDQVQLQVNHR